MERLVQTEEKDDGNISRLKSNKSEDRLKRAVFSYGFMFNPITPRMMKTMETIRRAVAGS